MGRINPTEFDNYSNSNDSEWLKLQNDGDVARVQFLYESFNDLDTYVIHKVKVGDYDRYVDCKRDYDSPIDDCPFCASGLQAKPVVMISMYDHEDGKVKIWERGKTFLKKMEALFNRYPNLSNMVFEIERRGAKGDKKTTYEIFPMPDVEPIDVSEVERPEFLGSFILDKTPDEMQTYLDTGSFPEGDSNGNTNANTRSTRASRSSEGNNQQVTRRGGSRTENNTSRRSERF